MDELVDVITTGLIMLAFGGLLIGLFAFIEWVASALSSDRGS